MFQKSSASGSGWEKDDSAGFMYGLKSLCENYQDEIESRRDG
jgi:hypothetical protein